MSRVRDFLGREGHWVAGLLTPRLSQGVEVTVAPLRAKGLSIHPLRQAESASRRAPQTYALLDQPCKTHT